MRTMDDDLDLCDACGSSEWVPIVYGYPGAEMIERSALGEVGLGGCIVSEGQPYRTCRVCGADR